MTADARESPIPDDPFLWLEEIHGDRALAWVRAENERTLGRSPEGSRAELTTELLEVLESDERIPYVTRHGEHLYGLWRDADHVQGLWRRTTLDEYEAPAPEWEVLLDLDALGVAEGIPWQFSRAQLLSPAHDRALVSLSPDGGDAVAVRELDLGTGLFVEGGFEVPVAKTMVSWIDRDTVFVGTDFGPGSLTESSYARTARRWSRGQALADAPEVHAVTATDMLVHVTHDPTPGFERDVVREVPDFFTSRTLLLTDAGTVPIDVPEDVDVDLHREWLVLRPRTDTEIGGVVHAAGSLLAARLDDFLAGSRQLAVLFAPTSSRSLEDWAWTAGHLVLTLLEDVASRIRVLTPPTAAGRAGWREEDVRVGTPLASVSVVATDRETDEYWLAVTGFLTPPTLLHGVVGEGAPRPVKEQPASFDADGLEVQQHFAVSDDGTRVPYFQVGPRDLPLDGSAPTLLSGYGGFENSRLPSYSGVVGRGWLARGGVHVLANIRGGGEYGPAWHRAALRQDRHRAYEDFAAVARDLVARGVTVPARLGCEGRSNGGLLVGNMLTTYPELFGAVICGVPLLDMRRYTRLSAGASWIAEYGDPDVASDWEFIRTFSPYHNVRPGVAYPPTLVYAATSDDRVGPVQARKMVALLHETGVEDAWYFENTAGGHGGSADNPATARLQSLIHAFLWERLGGVPAAA
ncbi:prolyl oligopeptidase family serine peptidase [Clavibacter michiganensis]|uniref:prolyl oligopeptidase family serine peptidase n=1 Tax=Clavibacter michiganensis TaxID=28447 RepID=UPI0026DACB7F|nr:prolyl oligopeptidase family serine peptidase [Clavibacter michiganensis]MDO4025029.1 prolyl oligopeptidase family serine peptidase [Clavibacter michiganensis]MDO4033687.1 prolyl oligopeptidase family serine peptidase [Clavibacter michiganensis]MDO4046888.1 prolyl oligopeptidase family serine peptidase [Clavibacter michiganensis]MDO4075118.1 prolyl oligopeptidase family serine peptidase [Clavibacter michiganensis]MDO4106473.1 prolyl oligopeptidase family serine peptidase [Clavibacter michig